MNCYAIGKCCIVREVKFTEDRIPLDETASNEPTLINIETKKGDYNGPATEKPAKNLDFYPNKMCHKAA